MSAPTSSTDPFGQDASGSTAFRMTTSDIINEAFALCQIGFEGEDLTQEQYENGRRSLNLLLSNWQAQGIHLWTYEEGTLFPEPGKNSYTLEQVRATNHYTLTALTTAASETDTTVTLDSVELDIGQEQTADIAEDWYIGFLLADHSIQWTQVASRSGSDVTIDDGLSEDLSVGACVIFYRDQVASVERLLNVRRVDQAFTSGNFTNETPINFVSHQQFFNLPNKKGQGLPSEAYYQRSLPEGVLYLWQTPQNSATLINFTYERKIDDFVNNDDCADVPKYWLEAMCYGLADRLKVKYRVPAQLSKEIKEQASESLSQALTFDDENYDLSVTINRSV